MFIKIETENRVSMKAKNSNFSFFHGHDLLKRPFDNEDSSKLLLV